MHTVSTAFENRMRAESLTMARLWKITRSDGVVLRLTDHSSDLTYEDQIYQSAIGFTASAVHVSALKAQAQSVEFDIAVGADGFTEADIRGQRYVEAVGELMVIDWAFPANGVLKYFKGRFGRMTLTERGHAKVELRSLTGGNAVIGDEQYSQTCRAALGDSRCGINLEAVRVDFTVVTVGSRTDFTVDTLAGQADDFFAWGQLMWTAGDNEGQAMDVRTTVLSTKRVGLFFPARFPFLAGDTAILYAGCDKQASTCKAKFNNIINFRGEPFIPQWTQNGDT